MSLIPYIGGAIIGKGLNALGSWLGVKNQQGFNAREAQKQRDWQEKMYNLQNEYNLPSAQMERLNQAGLNPNLVYGDGATTLAASVGSGASASAQQAKIPDLDILGSYLNLRQQKENIDLTRAQWDLTRTQDREKEANIENIEADTELKEYQKNLLNSQRMKTDADYWRQEWFNQILQANGVFEVAVQKMKDEGAITSYQAQQLEEQYKVLPQRLQLELDKLNQEIANLQKTGKKIDQEVLTQVAMQVNLRAQAKEALSRVGVNNAQRNYLERLANLTDKQANKVAFDMLMSVANGYMDNVRLYQSSFGTDWISQLVKTFRLGFLSFGDADRSEQYNSIDNYLDFINSKY